jgi:hypothetical protein
MHIAGRWSITNHPECIEHFAARGPDGQHVVWIAPAVRLHQSAEIGKAEIPEIDGAVELLRIVDHQSGDWWRSKRRKYARSTTEAHSLTFRNKSAKFQSTGNSGISNEPYARKKCSWTDDIGVDNGTSSMKGIRCVIVIPGVLTPRDGQSCTRISIKVARQISVCSQIYG